MANLQNILNLQDIAARYISNGDMNKANEIAAEIQKQTMAQKAIEEAQEDDGADPEMSLFAPAIDVAKAIKNLMSGIEVTSNSSTDADEAFARMIQEQEDADFARALQAIEEQEANDAAIAKLLQADEDEAFARMIQEQEANDAAIAKLLQADEDEAFARMIQEQEDADFAFALSLQFEEADMLGASASYAGLGSLGQDYYNAFYAA